MMIRSIVGAFNYLVLLLFLVNPVIADTAVSDDRAPSSGATGLQTSEPKLEEITVTAERRSANLQSTPIAISATTGDVLQSLQINTFESLADGVPALSFSRAGADARIFIRGIGIDSVSGGGRTRGSRSTLTAYITPACKQP